MMVNELVSVLMPTYNVDKFVVKAVRSILNQTYKNIELIVVDDCSTDNTYDILKKLSVQDKRIRLFRNAQNSKICKTLNRAYMESSGEYILRMDGDDISEPHRIEVLMSFLQENPEIALVGSYINSIDEKGEFLTVKKFPKKPLSINKALNYQSCVLHIWLARREIYEKLNGYREVPYVEDYDFLLRGRNHGFLYGNVDIPVYSVRTRTGNTASSHGLMQQKSRLYVRRINKKNEFFDYEDYIEQTNCSYEENVKYDRAFASLQIALRSRNNKLKMVFYTLKAAFSSKYIRLHLCETIIVRLIVFREQLFKNK